MRRIASSISNSLCVSSCCSQIPDRVETTARNRSKEEMKVAANLVSFQTSHAGCTLPPSPVSSRGVASDMDRSEKRGIVQEIHPKENVRSVTLSRQDLQPNIFCSVHASRSADELSLKSGSTRHKHWTAEEDEVLKVAVEEEGRIWNVVSKNYFQGHRNAAQCKVRWMLVR
jgi:Myb-like DNA-binding domain